MSSEEVSGYRPDKAKYFQNLILQYRRAGGFDVGKVLLQGGLLDKTGLSEQERKNLWRNVSEHALMQTAAAVELARALGLEEEQIKKIGAAALIHDHDAPYQKSGLKAINKRIESGEIASEQGGKIKYEFFDESEEHSAQSLRDQGVPEEIIKIASADGHPAIKRILDPDCSIEEKIMQYVGSITSNNDLVPLEERIRALEQNTKYKEMNEYGKQVGWTNGRTLYDMQWGVGHELEAEFVNDLNRSGILPGKWSDELRYHPTQLSAYIKSRIEGSYAA